MRPMTADCHAKAAFPLRAYSCCLHAMPHRSRQWYRVYTIRPAVKPVEQPVECLFTRCSQPVVQPVVQPVWQPVVSCKRGMTVTSALSCAVASHVHVTSKSSTWNLTRFACFTPTLLVCHVNLLALHVINRGALIGWRPPCSNARVEYTAADSLTHVIATSAKSSRWRRRIRRSRRWNCDCDWSAPAALVAAVNARCQTAQWQFVYWNSINNLSTTQLLDRAEWLRLSMFSMLELTSLSTCFLSLMSFVRTLS